jgi:hypothetical protein
MRTPPQHDRAALTADAATLRACAARLEALAAGDLPAQDGTDWAGILASLAKRCEVAAADLERAAALYAEDATAVGGHEAAAGSNAGTSGIGAGVAGLVHTIGAALARARRPWPPAPADPASPAGTGPLEL